MPTTLLTFEEFERLPDQPGKRELLNGELIELPPAEIEHDRIARRIYKRLDLAVTEAHARGEASELGEVCIESGYQSSGHSWVKPDVSVAHPAQLEGKYLLDAPAIAVEVVSPRNRADDLDTKTQLYFQFGAREVWVVYPKTRHVVVHVPGAARVVDAPDAVTAPAARVLPARFGNPRRVSPRYFPVQFTSNSSMGTSVSELLRFADIEVDPRTLQVWRSGAPVELEPKALRVLLHLIENRDRVVSKAELIADVWGGAAVTDNSLTRAIALLRRQLGDNARAPHLIETAATAGYRFIASLDAQAVPHRPIRRWRGWIAVAAGCAAIVAAAAVLRNPPPEPARVTRIQQLTASAQADLWPAYSPDGAQIAFSSNRTGHFELYVQPLAPGSMERSVTKDFQDNIQPAWSPDGKMLAFVAKVRGGIGIVPVNGGPVRYLTSSGSDPHWSPDGKSLVYRSGNLNTVREPLDWDSTLWVVGVDGGAPRQITRQGSPHGGHNFPRWLPDGRGVIFAERRTGTKSALWMVDLPTGTVRPLNIPLDVVRYPAVTTDGRYLYFVGAGDREPLGVWRTRLRPDRTVEHPQVVLPATGAVPRDLAITPDGAHLAISQEVGASEIWSVPVDSTGAAAGEASNLTPGRSYRSSDPVFSADGSKIAYTQARQGGKVQVFIADADGSSAQVVSGPEQNGVMPDWIGAEATVGYQTFGRGESGYWLASLTGPPKRLDVNLPFGAADRVRISRDGERVLANTGGPAGTRIVVVDRASLTLRHNTPPERDIGFGCWSPDGKWIAAEERVNGKTDLVVFPSKGGAIRTLISEPVESWPHDWAPDNDRIVFAGLRGGLWNIYWVSLSTGRIQQVTRYLSQSAFVRYPAWSPRGDRIIFEHNELNANVFVAEVR